MRRALPPSLALIALLSAPSAMAAGSEPPVKTQTSENCTDGQVWDATNETCVDARDSRLDDTTRQEAARELAAFGRPEEALAVLAGLDAPDHPDALTIRGFATRKAGDLPGALDLYQAALARDPNHLLARSYMGQGLAEAGRVDEARAQLALIRAAGGRGTWPETSLAQAIETGRAAY